MKLFYAILRDREGATAIEYGLIAVLICLMAVAGMQGIGGTLALTFENLEGHIANEG